jgi:hypothetical protein
MLSALSPISPLDYFRPLVARHALPQALLLHGDGSLPEEVALGIAGLFYCTSTAEKPCGLCPDCEQLAYHKHPQVLWLDHTHTPFQAVEAEVLSNHLMLHSPSELHPRIVILLAADNMVPAAAQKLLKTIEEPLGYGCFISTTAYKYRLLPTILSRLVAWTLRGNDEPPPSSDHNTSPLEEALRQVLLSNGRIKDPWSVLEQAGWLNKEFTTMTLVGVWEKTINRYYKERLAHTEGLTQGHPTEVIYQPHMPRSLLKKIRKSVGKHRISLNQDMIFNALISSLVPRV